VSKRLGSPYRSGRSAHWVKVYLTSITISDVAPNLRFRNEPMVDDRQSSAAYLWKLCCLDHSRLQSKKLNDLSLPLTTTHKGHASRLVPGHDGRSAWWPIATGVCRVGTASAP
jgi:hypothetical protein